MHFIYISNISNWNCRVLKQFNSIIWPTITIFTWRWFDSSFCESKCRTGDTFWNIFNCVKYPLTLGSLSIWISSFLLRRLILIFRCWFFFSARIVGVKCRPWLIGAFGGYSGCHRRRFCNVLRTSWGIY